METTESGTETFQLTAEAAQAYEDAFVPAFFAQWVPALLDAAGVRAGQRILDVACGTGVVARAAADLAGDDAVTGLDLNPAMLDVARRVRPGITWRRGDAADLPFPTASFDVVVCQMALMFLPDRARAAREMARVVAPGGTVAVAVPAELAAQPAFAPFVAMAGRVAGATAAGLLSTYFACGDRAELDALLTAAGLAEPILRTEVGRYRFPSVDLAVATEIDGTPLRDRLDPGERAAVLTGAREVWRPFTSADGLLDAPFTTHVVAAHRPGA